VAGVTVGSRNTCYRAARYGLTRTGLAPVGLRQLLLAPSEIQASAASAAEIASGPRGVTVSRARFERWNLWGFLFGLVDGVVHAWPREDWGARLRKRIHKKAGKFRVPRSR